MDGWRGPQYLPIHHGIIRRRKMYTAVPICVADDLHTPQELASLPLSLSLSRREEEEKRENIYTYSSIYLL